VTRIDGAGHVGTITINFSTPPARSALACCRPARSRHDRRHDVTCIDNGMPLVIFGRDVGRTDESVAELNADTAEGPPEAAPRLRPRDGLGDVTAKLPKMTLIAPPTAAASTAASSRTSATTPSACSPR
jgi:2-methylaconitate cis-trans-isomerase PrpF